MLYRLLSGSHARGEENSEGLITKVRYNLGDLIELTPKEARSQTFAGRVELVLQPSEQAEENEEVDITSLGVRQAVEFVSKLESVDEVVDFRTAEADKTGGRRPRVTILNALDERLEELSEGGED